MKKLFKLIAFAFLLIFGLNTASAQTLTEDASKPDVIAKTKTTDLTKELKLNGDQERAVYRYLVSNEVNYSKHITGKDLNDPEVIANKKKFDESLQASMKTTLTDEQYKKWLTLPKQ